MFEWKVEEMALLNGNNHVNFENSVSRDDKIAFVDSKQDGKLSYILSLIEKFNLDKQNMPKKDSVFGEPKVKTISLKAWIRRNDNKYPEKLIDDWYDYGSYSILGCKRYIQSQHKGTYDYYEDLVDEVFHRQLIECEREEQKYFHEHDEYSILKKEFKKKLDQYGTTFGVRIVTGNSGVWIADSENERDITIEELKELLSKYAQIDSLVEKLTTETSISY